MLQGEHGRNRSTVLSGHPDLKFVPHKLKQVSEPRSGLGEQFMAFPSRYQEAVKFVKKSRGLTGFIRKSLSFGSQDLPPDGVIVQMPKELVQSLS